MNVIGIIDQAKKLTESETDSALSKYLGLSRTAVSNYRRGVSYPDTITCERLAGITGIPLAKVLGIVGEARAISREEKAVWRKLAATAALIIFACGLQIEAHANAVPTASDGARAIHYAKLKVGATPALSGPKRQDLPHHKRRFSGPSGKATKVGPRSRQRFPVEPWRFREARLSVGLGIDRCADLLHVSERTVRNWEAGTARVPYAAYKLMRVLRGGKVLGPDWRGFHVWRDTLVTPEGHRFLASDLAWWSLQVRMAREWQRGQAARRSGTTVCLPVSTPSAHDLAPEAARLAVSEANPNRTASGAHLRSSADLSACQSLALVDGPRSVLLASPDRKRVQKNRLPELPTSNRGVSEPERTASESVPLPPKLRAATLPQAGVAAPRLAVGGVA